LGGAAPPATSSKRRPIVQTKKVKMANLNSHPMAGACEEKKIDDVQGSGDEAAPYVRYEFEATDRILKTTSSGCDINQVQILQKFQLKTAKNASDLYFTDRESNSEVVVRPKILKPVECTLLANPDADYQLALFESEIEDKKSQASELKLLSFFRMNIKDPKEIREIGHFFSYNIGEGSEIYSIDQLCDLESDGFTEVILTEQKYAGEQYLALDLGKDFSGFSVVRRRPK
jgi:hypothetical protein